VQTDVIKRQVRVLHLEDNENDHFLVVETLSANELKCAFTLAKSREEFEVALRRAEYDLIISDFTLPSYDGLTALSLAREVRPETPFVFFSGSIGEDIAVDSLQHGAVDYVLKQRPGRLVSAIRRALYNADERVRLKQAESALHQMEERFRIVVRATNDVIWEWDVQNNRIWFSEHFQTAYGHEVGEAGMMSSRWFDFIHPDDKSRVVSGISTLLASGGKVWWSEHRIRRADGSYAHIFDRASFIYDDAGKPQMMVGVKIDMSERKRA
jgi:PAS domain S-box-containing protein